MCYAVFRFLDTKLLNLGANEVCAGMHVNLKKNTQKIIQVGKKNIFWRGGRGKLFQNKIYTPVLTLEVVY